MDRLPAELLVALACTLCSPRDRARLACVCQATAAAARIDDFWAAFGASYGLEHAKRLKLLARSGRKLPVAAVYLTYRCDEGDPPDADIGVLPLLIGLLDAVHPGAEQFMFSTRTPHAKIDLPSTLFVDLFQNLKTLRLRLNNADFSCE